MRLSRAAMGCSILLLLIGGGVEKAAAQDKYPGTLQIVGALHCRLALAEGEPRLERTLLNCQYRQHNHSQKPVQLTGEMVGSGLWLVNPGVVSVMWNVLAPTPTVHPRDIAGDYDIEPSYNYALADKRSNILYGGLGDTFALELVSARLDGISPSTRMTLRVGPSNPAVPTPG
jgi:hypothetical protein